MRCIRNSMLLVAFGVLFAVTASCALCDTSSNRPPLQASERTPQNDYVNSTATRSYNGDNAALPLMTEIELPERASPRRVDTPVDAVVSSVPDLLRTVPSVDLARYMGRWFEVARVPNRYQSGVVGVIAEYELGDDGRITVRNFGRSGSLDADLTVSTAAAWVADESTNAKWYVQFIWPFKADYWIIDLDRDYQFAVVGQPDRERLWILSRTSTMPQRTLDGVYRRLEANGYDTSRIQQTPQRLTD